MQVRRVGGKAGETGRRAGQGYEAVVGGAEETFHIANDKLTCCDSQQQKVCRDY